MGFLEELVPNQWERQRLIGRLVIGVVIVVLGVLLAMMPGCRTRSRVAQARRDLNTVAEQVRNWQKAQGGKLPSHRPMARVAKLRVDVAEAGGEGLTTFDPLQFVASKNDLFSAGDGTQPFIYFAGTNPPIRWLLASVGPDERYQLKMNNVIEYAHNGGTGLVALQYDPTNGTKSAGDIIIVTGP
jgi:hypothetical protein